MVIQGCVQSSKNSEFPDAMLLAEVEKDDILPFYFPHSYIVNKCPNFAFLCLFLIILSLKVAPKHTAEILCSIPRYKVESVRFHKRCKERMS